MVGRLLNTVRPVRSKTVIDAMEGSARENLIRGGEEDGEGETGRRAVVEPRLPEWSDTLTGFQLSVKS